MHRHHNPPYAPQSLEPRLNPSGPLAIPVAAEVMVMAGIADSTPPPGNGDPPVGDPNIPIGPAGPALAT